MFQKPGTAHTSEIDCKKENRHCFAQYLKSWTNFWLRAPHDEISFFNVVPTQDWQATLQKR